MEHSRFLSGLILTALLSQVSPSHIVVEELEDKAFVRCNATLTWMEETVEQRFEGGKVLNLGKRILDPRGVYRCTDITAKANTTTTLQVYYRMCQNCVELDSATLAGIIISDIIATVLLAVGVYCFAGHETGRFSSAAGTQALLGNDQLYQPLRDRNDAQYSRLGEKWARNK